MTSAEQTRSDLLAALAKLGQIHPQWRMGQTLANLAMSAGRLEASGVWDLEDHEALAAALEMIERHGDGDPPSLPVTLSTPSQANAVQS